MAATQVADEDVEADRRRFEADEERHEVVGLREQHEGRGDDHEDVVIVRNGSGPFFKEADCEEARQQGAEQERHADALGGVSG